MTGITIGITFDEDGLIDETNKTVEDLNNRITKDEKTTDEIYNQILSELEGSNY